VPTKLAQRSWRAA